MDTSATIAGQADTPEKVSSSVLGQRQDKPGTETPLSVPIGKDLADEILQFCNDCSRRYKFNNRWDNVLNVAGILLSVGIVASGIYQKGAISAILGAVVAAIVTAQKAYPFGQRSNFYRVLIGQCSNLETDVRQALISKQDAVAILKSLRLDFAQQLPRGSTFNSGDASESAAAPKS